MSRANSSLCKEGLGRFCFQSVKGSPSDERIGPATSHKAKLTSSELTAS